MTAEPASAEVRAQRRCLELEQRGTPKPYDEVLHELNERDYNDSHRAAAPLRALHSDASDASWALRWVGSHKNVHVILSGMSAEDQLTDNLATFGHFEPLSPAENAAVESVANELHRRIKIGCTGCRYCMPCPMGVDIPDNFSIWNKLGMFGQKDAIKAQWTTCFPDSEKALHCVRCGKCEAVCPQKLPIRDSLAQLQKELDAL